MMHLMMLPDWNSLDSVRRAHSDLEAGGLVFFALLVTAEAFSHTAKADRKKHIFDTIGIWVFAIAVLCEIGGFWYGRRNDDLSGQIISSLDQKAKGALQASDTAISQSKQAEQASGMANSSAAKAVVAASNALTLAAGARKEISQQGPRYSLFAGEAGRRFKLELIGFSGQKLVLNTAASSISNPEVQTLKIKLLTEIGLHADPNWDVTFSEVEFVSPEVSLWISSKSTEKTREAAVALAQALGRLGIYDVNGHIPPFVEKNVDSVPSDTIWLTIGAHMAINKRALDGSLR